MMGASGLDQLMMMEVSPTSSTSWSEGASGAVEAQAQTSHHHIVKYFKWEYVNKRLTSYSTHFILLYFNLFCYKMAFCYKNGARHNRRSGFSLSRQNGVFVFLSCKSQCFCTYSSRLPVFKRAYSREFLLDVGKNHIFRVKLRRTPKRAAGPRSAPEAYTITDPHYCISPTAEALQAAVRGAEEG